MPVITAPAHAALWLALLIGGSGEAEKPENFFKEDFSRLRAGLEARGWETRTAFAGKKHTLERSVPATQATIDQLFKEAEARLKPGDEALVVLHSHGFPRWEPFEDTHSLLIEDDHTYAVDAVVRWVERMEAAGVRAAVADLSCYSGTLQPEHPEPQIACRMSLAAASYVSICSGQDTSRGFVRAFVDLPPPGKPLSLEEHFLNARASDATAENFPRLSSLPAPAHWEWDAFLSETDPSVMDAEKWRPECSASRPLDLADDVLKGLQEDGVEPGTWNWLNLEGALTDAAQARIALDGAYFSGEAERGKKADELFAAGSDAMGIERAIFDAAARGSRGFGRSRCAQFGL